MQERMYSRGIMPVQPETAQVAATPIQEMSCQPKSLSVIQSRDESYWTIPTVRQGIAVPER
ncbi:hypothetical protein GCM10022196_21450 [Aeromicrobium flavum]